MMKLKIFKWKQVLDILDLTRDEVIHCDDVIAFLNEAVAKMGAQEACGAGNQDSGLSH